TENQNALCAQRESLAFQVPDQASAVGVVAQQTAVGGFFQGIHGPGTTRPLTEGIGQAIRLFLGRHGDIGAVPFAKKLTGKTSKIIQRRQQRLVTQLLARLFRKQPVNQRRLAVANGIAEYAVAVHEIPRFFWTYGVTVLRSLPVHSGVRQPVAILQEILGQARFFAARLGLPVIAPAHLRWQGHEDRLGTPARLQAEQGATVPDQVEFHIAAATERLKLTLRL